MDARVEIHEHPHLAKTHRAVDLETATSTEGPWNSEHDQRLGLSLEMSRGIGPLLWLFRVFFVLWSQGSCLSNTPGWWTSQTDSNGPNSTQGPWESAWNACKMLCWFTLVTQLYLLLWLIYLTIHLKHIFIKGQIGTRPESSARLPWDATDGKRKGVSAACAVACCQGHAVSWDVIWTMFSGMCALSLSIYIHIKHMYGCVQINSSILLIINIVTMFHMIFLFLTLSTCLTPHPAVQDPSQLMTKEVGDIPFHASLHLPSGYLT